MADSGPDWEALGRVFAALPSASAELSHAPDDGDALARELAEERAAIMEYDGGLARELAERLAYQAQGLQPPGR